MQRLVTNKVIDFKGARYITDTLWMLMESGIEVIFNYGPTSNLCTFRKLFRHSLPLIQLSMYFSGSKNPANIDVDFNIKSCSSKRNTRPLFSHMLPLAFHSGFYSKYYSWCNHKAVSTSRFGTSISSI